MENFIRVIDITLLLEVSLCGGITFAASPKDSVARKPNASKLPNSFTKTSKKSVDWSSLWRREDWWAVWLGFFILGIAAMRTLTWIPKISGWIAVTEAFPAWMAQYFVLLGIGLLALTSVAIMAMKERLKGYVAGFSIIFLLAFVALLIAANKNVGYWGLEYVIWALLFGLLISNTVGVPAWLKPAIKTELFIKTGLVLLGAEILFHTLLKAGVYGIIEATLGLLAVWYFCYYLAVKLGLSKSFASIMSSGIAICGVSAAIAAGGAVKGNPKEISYTVSMILLVAIPMLVGIPFISKAVGMNDAVVGAWIGGSVDTTPAVAAAGALYSKKAMDVAVVVKTVQNAMIGVTAFLLSLYWTLKVERKPGERPSPKEVWYRFPKFILGFLVASLIFSALLTPTMGETAVKEILSITSGIRGWFFAMTFVSIGLSTKFKELLKIGGGRPAIVFLTAQIFDILVTLLAAYLLFGGILFPSPI